MDLTRSSRVESAPTQTDSQTGRMIITLSPSKGQDFVEPPLCSKYTQPRDLKESVLLIEALRKLDEAAIKALMSVSDKIARLNVERFQAFSPPFNRKNAKQALFAFKGDVYSGMQLDQFTADDFAFAQDHLCILSGLYGCLRPLDLIQPYRLEMKTRLANPRGDNLYQFWDMRITDRLNQALKKQARPVLVNLASNEYFKAVKTKRLEGDLLNIQFKETRNGKTRIVAIFAKRARGMMADYIIRNRIENPQDIKKFRVGGYRFSQTLSDESQWTFERPQP